MRFGLDTWSPPASAEVRVSMPSNFTEPCLALGVCAAGQQVLLDLIEAWQHFRIMAGMGHRKHARSCQQGVPYGRMQPPYSTFLRSKCSSPLSMGIAAQPPISSVPAPKSEETPVLEHAMRSGAGTTTTSLALAVPKTPPGRIDPMNWTAMLPLTRVAVQL